MQQRHQQLVREADAVAAHRRPRAIVGEGPARPRGAVDREELLELRLERRLGVLLALEQKRLETCHHCIDVAREARQSKRRRRDGLGDAFCRAAAPRQRERRHGRLARCPRVVGERRHSGSGKVNVDAVDASRRLVVTAAAPTAVGLLGDHNGSGVLPRGARGCG